MWGWRPQGRDVVFVDAQANDNPYPSGKKKNKYKQINKVTASL